jgi:SAM-dependent methyltransferase
MSPERKKPRLGAAADWGMNMNLHDMAFAGLGLRNDFKWAWRNYRATVENLVEHGSGRSVIEIGGGRSPLFAETDIRRLGVDYTANDISPRELSLAPDWARKACFDVQAADRSAVEPFAGRYDLAMSKMVMEHVESYERAYQTIYQLLRPGGVTLAFHPTLFALPFLINHMIPEKLSDRILGMIFDDRSDQGEPKFPACYSGCRVSNAIVRTLEGIGFSEVIQIPFYGHDYYRHFPGMSTINRSVAAFARSRDLRFMATYAYTIARK